MIIIISLALMTYVIVTILLNIFNKIVTNQKLSWYCTLTYHHTYQHRNIPILILDQLCNTRDLVIHHQDYDNSSWHLQSYPRGGSLLSEYVWKWIHKWISLPTLTYHGGNDVVVHDITIWQHIIELWYILKNLKVMIIICHWKTVLQIETTMKDTLNPELLISLTCVVLDFPKPDKFFLSLS